MKPQRLNHNFFLAHLSRNCFSLVDLPCSPNYPIQKNYSHLIHSFTYVIDFFFKFFFLFAIIVIIATMPSLTTIVDVQKRTRSWCNFKVWTTWGATFSRRHQNKVCLLHFFLHLWFLYIFSFGLSFWNFVLLTFRVHQHLDRAC